MDVKILVRERRQNFFLDEGTSIREAKVKIARELGKKAKEFVIIDNSDDDQALDDDHILSMEHGYNIVWGPFRTPKSVVIVYSKEGADMEFDASDTCEFVKGRIFDLSNLDPEYAPRNTALVPRSYPNNQVRNEDTLQYGIEYDILTICEKRVKERKLKGHLPYLENEAEEDTEQVGITIPEDTTRRLREIIEKLTVHRFDADVAKEIDRLVGRLEDLTSV